MIRDLKKADIPPCAEILMSVYNNELWQCRWSKNTAEMYLADYADAGKFVGFVLELDGKVAGALLAHEKIWWNNSELFIDEMFVAPDYQRKGYGTELLEEAERYVKESGLAGFTLTTNRNAPAPEFYRKNGFTDAKHVLYMCKGC